VPFSAIVRGDPGALLETEMLPLVPTAVVGANLTLKETLWPGFSV
jgi:hypothetical protein